ncbi:unnamed protein product [Spodoptera littoralis]|uniref:Uncharacterized protein n=1 Tax=Spodoptera littoralis TaxID=7109 RepID=A0A9P0I7Q4_SPOLI|nr:unnamed protein product [Spodoptera littoralis]CAH1642609.1 unnamed protein product [Spodoptera littoralis]
MDEFACVLLFTIFAHTNTLQPPSKYSNRNVNFALETVLKFDKDQSGDRQLLNTVEKYIQDAMHYNKPKDFRRQLSSDREHTFTSFIQQAINILKTYDDTGFRVFFQILDDELRNCHYIGSKFYELTETYETRMVLSEKLDLIKGKPVFRTRSIINSLGDALRTQKYDSKVKDFVDFLNSLYTQDDEKKFHKVLKDLEAYSRTRSWADDNLVKIIREAVRSLIFDHYTDLNTNTRRELKERIASFVKHSKVSPTTTGRNSFTTDNIPNRRIETVSNKRRSIITAKNISTSPSPIHKIGRLGFDNSEPVYKDISASNMKYKPSEESESNSIEQSQEKPTEVHHTTGRYVTLYEEEFSPAETIQTTQSKIPDVFANVQRFKLDDHKHALRLTNTTTESVQWNIPRKINVMDSYKRVIESLKKIGSVSIIDMHNSPTKAISRNYTIPPKSIKFHALLNVEPQTTSFAKRHIGEKTKHNQTFASGHVHSDEERSERSVDQTQKDLEKERKHLRRSLSNNRGNLGVQDLRIILERLNYLEKQIEELKQPNVLRGCPTNDKNQTVKCLSRSSNGRDENGDAFGDIVIRKCDRCNVSRLYRKVLKTNKTQLYHTNEKLSHKLKADQTKQRSTQTLLLKDRQRARETTSTVNLSQVTHNKMHRDFTETIPLGASYTSTDGGRRSKNRIRNSDKKSKRHTTNRGRSTKVLEFSSPPHYDIFHPSVVW